MKLSKPCIPLVFLLCTACVDQQEGAPSATPELILTNGQVKTPSGWVEAIAISGDRIIAMGGSDVIEALAGEHTQIMNLDRKVVLPGFHDRHVHPLFGGLMYSGADNTNCKIAQGSTKDQLIETLRHCVSRVADSEWVTGGQWDASALGETPNRSMIDAISLDTPVLINDTSGHSAWANSRALEIAGVDSKTVDPEGGIIERDADGVPTGILRESAIWLVRAHVPPPSDLVIRKSLQWSLETMLAYGITSFSEASAGFVAGSTREAALYALLADEGILKQRVRLCINWTPVVTNQDLIANRGQYERARLALDCVKILLDGVPTDGHTAAMLEPYSDTVEGRDDEASRYGLLVLEQSVTNEAVTGFDAQGLTVKFHAAGDAAVRSGLDAIAAARKANGMSALRHNVGHCTFISKEDISRAKALNATLELSPYLWSPSPINDDITQAIGPERIERVWPFREAIDSGALVVPGSDWAVVPSVNPWIAIETLVTREEPGGSDRRFGQAQAIGLDEAIDLFTVNAAKHMGAENKLGKIEPEMLADFIVIDRNPFAIPVTELHRIKVLMTFIGGEKVFDSAAPPSR